MRYRVAEIMIIYAVALVALGVGAWWFSAGRLEGSLPGLRPGALVAGIAVVLLAFRHRGAGVLVFGADLASLLLLVNALNYTRLAFRWYEPGGPLAHTALFVIGMAVTSFVALALLQVARPHLPHDTPWWRVSPLVSAPALLLPLHRARRRIPFQRQMLLAVGLLLTGSGIVVLGSHRLERSTAAVRSFAEDLFDDAPAAPPGAAWPAPESIVPDPPPPVNDAAPDDAPEPHAARPGIAPVVQIFATAERASRPVPRARVDGRGRPLILVAGERRRDPLPTPRRPRGGEINLDLIEGPAPLPPARAAAPAPPVEEPEAVPAAPVIVVEDPAADAAQPDPSDPRSASDPLDVTGADAANDADVEAASGTTSVASNDADVPIVPAPARHPFAPRSAAADSGTGTGFDLFDTLDTATAWIPDRFRFPVGALLLVSGLLAIATALGRPGRPAGHHAAPPAS